jgi:hypothetical protein
MVTHTSDNILVTKDVKMVMKMALMMMKVMLTEM